MLLQHGFSKLLIGSTAFLFGTAGFNANGNSAPAAVQTQTATQGNALGASASAAPATSAVGTRAKAALAVFSSAVRKLSDPRALKDAFNSYFAFKATHPNDVKKPYLYFVDYGLPNTEARGYVFDMAALKVVDGPFTVAHGRGSAPSGASIPTRFSNAFGSAATSLGLYIAKATYAFHGHSGGPTVSVDRAQAGRSVERIQRQGVRARSGGARRAVRHAEQGGDEQGLSGDGAGACAATAAEARGWWNGVPVRAGLEVDRWRSVARRGRELARMTPCSIARQQDGSTARRPDSRTAVYFQAD